MQDIKHVLQKIRNNMESSRSDNKSKPGRYIIKKIIAQYYGIIGKKRRNSIFRMVLQFI